MAPYYFSNLKDRFGNNIKNSCTYVAIDRLLSYYDSFWDDGFLPERYDGEVVSVSETVINAKISPGSKIDSSIYGFDEHFSDEEYYRFIRAHRNDTLHFDLLSRAIEQLGLYNSSSKSLHLATFLKDAQDVIKNYLDYSTPLGSSSVNIRLENTDSDKRRKTIVNLIRQGIPVIVDARKDETHGAHSFIAYDYDEDDDEIYCNAGWYEQPSYHVSRSDLGFTYIQEILYFEPKIEHRHSFNYSRLGEEGEAVNICACSARIPTKIEISENFLDTNPTFCWNSLIKERWAKKYKFSHTLSFLKGDRYEVFQITGIRENRHQLKTDEWAKVINDAAKPNYYAYLTIESDDYPYLDDFYYKQLFTEPNRYKNKSSFLPEDWGFQGRYYFSNELDPSHLSDEPERRYTTCVQNGLTIETNRLRCGYIEESYIVLSPRREGAGRSYFERNFDKPVYSFRYHACLWSRKEYLDGIAVLQTKSRDGNWSTLGDMPISALNPKENGFSSFIESTPKGILGLRFETTASATGDRNKGRLCLGDIVFQTSDSSLGNSSYVDYDYKV